MSESGIWVKVWLVVCRSFGCVLTLLRDGCWLKVWLVACRSFGCVLTLLRDGCRLKVWLVACRSFGCVLTLLRDGCWLKVWLVACRLFGCFLTLLRDGCWLCHICPYVSADLCLNGFLWKFVLGILGKSVAKIKISLISNQNIGTLHKDLSASYCCPRQ